MSSAEAEKDVCRMVKPNKAEIIRDSGPPDGEPLQGRRVPRLCRGPHLPMTDKIVAFKLLNVAGAYWRGNEKNKMLTRVYGTAFATQKELDAHLNQIEEAKKRDHRRLGKDLDLFSFQEEGRSRPGLLASQGRHDPQAGRGLLARRAHQGGLRLRQFAAHWQGPSLGDQRAS